MFSPRFFKLTSYLASLAHTYGIFALKYNAKNRQFVHCLSRRTIFNTIYYFSMVLFWVYRTIEAKLAGNKGDFHTACVFSLMGVLNIVISYIFLFNSTMAAIMFTSFLHWAVDFQERWMPHWNPKTSLTGRLLENIVTCFAIGCLIFGPPLPLIHHILSPKAGVFPYSLVPEDYDHWSILVLFIIAFVLHGFIFIVDIAAILLLILSYLFAMVPLITKEFRPNQLNYTTSNRLRKPFNLMFAYRTLEVMHLLAIELVGNLVLPFYTAICQFILFCNVSALREGTVDVILIVFSIVAQMVLFIILEFAGRYNKNSEVTLKSWKYFSCSNFEMKCLSKFKRSCVPLKAETKGYFVIKRLTVIKSLRAVIRGTFRALLTLKGSRL